MRSLLVSLFFLLSVCGPSAAQPNQFKGWVFFEKDDEPLQSVILRNEKELEVFRKRIPKQVPTKKHPAPANKDPLLSGSPVDFTKHILVLALRDETISAHPSYLASDSQQDKVVVWFEIPEPPPEARPFGWGVYRGVLIPKTSKPIIVKFD